MLKGDNMEPRIQTMSELAVKIAQAPALAPHLGAMRLARDIVKKIEDGLQYPGQIKVTVLRETRAIDYAK